MFNTKLEFNYQNILNNNQVIYELLIQTLFFY